MKTLSHFCNCKCITLSIYHSVSYDVSSNFGPSIELFNYCDVNKYNFFIFYLVYLPEVEARTQGLRPRPRTKDTNASVFLRKKVLEIFFPSISKKKNDLEKHVSANLQNFNHSKNSAVLELRKGRFSRT